MSSEHEPLRAQLLTKRSWPIWLAVLVVPILAVVIGVLALYSRVQRINAVADKLPAMIKKARADGLALTNADMNKGATETSPQFLDAVVEFELQRKRGVFGSQKYFQLKDGKGIFGGPGLDRGLDALSKTITLLQACLDQDQCTIVLEWDTVDGVPGIWSETIETVAKALCVRGYRLVKTGDWISAEKDFHTVESLAAQVSTWPSSDGFLLSNNCVARLRETILQLASENTNNVDLLDKLRHLAANLVNVVSPIPAVRGEIFYDVSNIRNAKRGVMHGRAYSGTGKTPTPSNAVDHDEFPTDARVRGAIAYFLQEAIPVWEKVKSDPGCLPTIGKEWDAVKDRLLKKDDIFALLSGAQQNPFAVVNRAVWSRLESEQTAMMIDCMIFRSNHGAWPSSASDLKERYIDPFSMKDLLLRKATNGYRIYRVGDNGKDDGGDTAVEAMGTKKVTDDLVVIDIHQPVP